jgi:hypothetical protein
VAFSFIWRRISEKRFSYPVLVSHAGLIACLFFNIIATTTAWIKGEGTVESYLIDI